MDDAERVRRVECDAVRATDRPTVDRPPAQGALPSHSPAHRPTSNEEGGGLTRHHSLAVKARTHYWHPDSCTAALATPHTGGRGSWIGRRSRCGRRGRRGARQRRQDARQLRHRRVHDHTREQSSAAEVSVGGADLALVHLYRSTRQIRRLLRSPTSSSTTRRSKSLS